MAKNILRRHFSNMYGKDKVLQGKTTTDSLLNKMSVNLNDNFKNSNTQELNNGPQLKRIMKNEFKNIYGKEKLGNLNKNTEGNMLELKPVNMTVSIIIFFTSLIILLSILYYYRIEIFEFFKKKSIQTDKGGNVSDIEKKCDGLIDKLNKKIESDEKELSEMKEKINNKDSIEKNEIKNKENDKKLETGGVASLNSKIETKYKNNQIVKGNGYCYIGFDNHMRECIDVYEGDICMSGQIFPTLDVCVNPEFRP